MKASNMNARLKHLQRPLEPQYADLMPDGAFCLLLPKTRHKPGVRVKKPDYICSFDMFSKSCLCFGHVHNYHVNHPVILPSDFFRDCYPARRKWKPPTLERKPTMQASSGRICWWAGLQLLRLFHYYICFIRAVPCVLLLLIVPYLFVTINLPIISTVLFGLAGFNLCIAA